MNRIRQFFFTGLAVCFFVCGVQFAAVAAAGPESSVIMLQKGIDTKDLAMVETYLDVDGVVAKAVETVINDEDVLRAIEKKSFPIAAILAMGNADQTAPMLRDFLASEVKEYIRHGVVSGAFAGKPEEGVSIYQGVFRKAFRGGEKNKIVFRNPVVKKSDKTGTVSCFMASGKKGREYPLELLAVPEGKGWRIVELRNAAGLVKQAMEKSK